MASAMRSASDDEMNHPKNEKIAGEEPEVVADGYSIKGGEDILALQDIDPALNAKMHLVNNAIDEIGWTNYHWKLFVLNGFGYCVDSLLLLLQSIIATPAGYEFSPSYPHALTIAVYVGMLLGALFWGMSADVIGRRFAFNVSLFLCSAFTIVAGAAPNWTSLAVFIAFLGFGGAWLAAWWGLGQSIAGFFAWAFLTQAKWNCPLDKNNVPIGVCGYDNNKGWRYLMYTSGALVFFMSIARITVIRLKETPKFLLGEGKDEQLVQGFQEMALKYGKTCSLTVEQLDACGVIQSAHGKSKLSLGELTVHFRGLFSTKKIGLSTCLVWLSWTLIGLAYPLFYVFLGSYLSSRGAEFGSPSPSITWRNYALVNISSIPGPMVAGWMCNMKILGRKYTMVIGALCTMAFFFAYTQVRNEAQNLGFSCAIAFFLDIYYGCLYAYTPEVLPSAHRATGNGVAVACNRIMGIISALIATYAKTATSVPIYVCAALFFVMAVVSASFPFEPYGKRSS